MNQKKLGAPAACLLAFTACDQLIDAPVTRVFQLADADKSGGLSLDEAASALELIASSVGIPTAALMTPSSAARHALTRH